MKQSLSGALLVCIAFAAGTSPVLANLIDFDSHASTGQNFGTPPAAAVVTNDYASLGVVFGRDGLSAGVTVVANPSAFSQPNGACGLDAAGITVAYCTGDIYFNFVDPGDGVTPATTNAITFVIGDAGGDLDSWIIHVYAANDVLLTARSVASSSNISQSFNYPSMERVWVQWTATTGAGYLLDDLEFAVPTVNVPEPGTFALLGIGLVGLAALSRRKLD